MTIEKLSCVGVGTYCTVCPEYYTNIQRPQQRLMIFFSLSKYFPLLLYCHTNKLYASKINTNNKETINYVYKKRTPIILTNPKVFVKHLIHPVIKQYV